MIIRDDEGKPFSKWKPAAKFSYMFRESGHADLLQHCEAEHAFDDTRGWRFDFAWPAIKLAVEIDGFGAGGMGRHQFIAGQAEDNEKLNAAVSEGWKVLRYNSRQLGSKSGVEDAVHQVISLIVEWD